MAQADENARRREMNERIIEEYRANDGRVEAFPGVDLLLLHHVGAHSGAPYVAPLAYLRHGSGYVLMAANAGRPRHPSWYHNLLAHPAVRIEVRASTLDVHAREAQGAEREELVELARAESRYYADFEKSTTRRIPLLVLESAHAE